MIMNYTLEMCYRYFFAACPYKTDAIFEMDSTLIHNKDVFCVKADNFDFSIRTQQRILKI